jgi:hypothetical protein
MVIIINSFYGRKKLVIIIAYLLFIVTLDGLGFSTNASTVQYTEPIVLVILKSACFLIHALLPRDLKARGLKKSAR